MYDPAIVKRTQIYLDPERSQDLARRAKVRGITSSHLIREAVAQYLAVPGDDASVLAAQRAAIHDAAGRVPRLPSGSDHVEALRAADRARDQALDERWRSR
jgi:hypothetical protein